MSRLNLRVEFHPFWRWQLSKENGCLYWQMPHDWVVRVGPLWIMSGAKHWRSELRDTDRLDWLQGMMLRDENYCEIYLAGLRNWTGAATAYQVESNPEKFPTVTGPDLRTAIDNAMKAQGKKP